MWTFHRLLMCVYLSLDLPAVLTVTMQRCLCTGWGQWQLGDGDNIDLLFLLLASPSSFSFSFTIIITAFVPSSSRIVHNFVRCYRKHYRTKPSGKQLLWNIKPVIQNFMPLKKMYLLCWKEVEQCSLARRCTVASSVSHQECRAFFYVERALIHIWPAGEQQPQTHRKRRPDDTHQGSDGGHSWC